MNTTTKYPRTLHLPWSLSASSDDCWLNNVDHFVGKEIICSVKLDGEGSNLTATTCHARSVDSRGHASRHWLKAKHGSIARDIPDGFCIYGENMYAEHSIPYSGLTTYFYVFGIKNNNLWLSWDSVCEWCQLLDLETVPVLYRGIWDEEKVKACYSKDRLIFGGFQEGYVVRLASEFTDFSKSLAKFVRANHVQTDEHWMENWKPNQLCK